MTGVDVDRLISVAAAAGILGISTKTLKRWADRGDIAFTRTLGGHRRFSEREVREVAAVQPVPLVAQRAGHPIDSRLPDWHNHNRLEGPAGHWHINGQVPHRHEPTSWGRAIGADATVESTQNRGGRG